MWHLTDQSSTQFSIKPMRNKRYDTICFDKIEEAMFGVNQTKPMIAIEKHRDGKVMIQSCVCVCVFFPKIGNDVVYYDQTPYLGKTKQIVSTHFKPPASGFCEFETPYYTTPYCLKKIIRKQVSTKTLKWLGLFWSHKTLRSLSQPQTRLYNKNLSNQSQGQSRRTYLSLA